MIVLVDMKGSSSENYKREKLHRPKLDRLSMTKVHTYAKVHTNAKLLVLNLFLLYTLGQSQQDLCDVECIPYIFNGEPSQWCNEQVTIAPNSFLKFTESASFGGWLTAAAYMTTNGQQGHIEIVDGANDTIVLANTTDNGNTCQYLMVLGNGQGCGAEYISSQIGTSPTLSVKFVCSETTISCNPSIK